MPPASTSRRAVSDRSKVATSRKKSGYVEARIHMGEYWSMEKFSMSVYDQIDAYSQWLQGYVHEKGWNPFLMTFMYKPLKGHTEAIAHQMKDEVDRVYSTFITRVVRNPNSKHQKYLRPILVAVPDRPVAKHGKQRLTDVTINDGRHIHGILVVPWDCRLKRDVRAHFEQYSKLYVKNRLLRLDVRPITSALGGVVDYAFKSVKSRKVDCDDIIIFPKSGTEKCD